MKQLKNLVVICALGMPFAAPAQDHGAPAAEPSEHEQHVGPAAETPATHQTMAAMQEHMRAMREQMARIQATEDPAERQRLMQEHMQSMQQTMRMMGSMHAQQRGSGGRCAETDAPCRMDEMQAENRMMRQRMGTMEERMQSMQQLMGEMMDHLGEAQRPR
jgi:hypothetical protein